MPKRPKNTPPHYQSLSLRNFRGFKKVENIPLAPLTFLVGPNSSGKSSIFDALLLITQSDFTLSSSLQVPNWAGPLVDLGSYKDTVYKHNSNLTIEIGIEISPDFITSRTYYENQSVAQPMRITFELRTAKSDPIGYLVRLLINDSLTGEELMLTFANNKVVMDLLDTERIWSRKGVRPTPFVPWVYKQIEAGIEAKEYHLWGSKSALRRILRLLPLHGFWSVVRQSERVSSGRAAPKRWYSIADTSFRSSTGPDRPRVFDTVDPIMIDETRRYVPAFQRLRRPVPKHTLTSVLSELEIGNQIHDTKLSPYHLGINIRDNITGVTSNLIDVGYGASQVIPVLKASLSGFEGPLFVEQPEIHLHPKAQGVIADILCDTSRNRQVVVETHSVRMINRARIQVAKGELPHSHVMVLYVERTKSGSRVYPIPILENGDFGADWPEGFFDERYEDTMLLLQLKTQRGAN